MTPPKDQPTVSEGLSRAEADRIWDALKELTATLQTESKNSIELKTSLKDLVTRMDTIISQGTPRCSDHNARVERMEYNIALIDKGEHPACRACQQGLKNWVYGSAIAASVSTIGTAISIITLIIKLT